MTTGTEAQMTREAVRNAIGASLLVHPGRDLEQATDEVMRVFERCTPSSASPAGASELADEMVLVPDCEMVDWMGENVRRILTALRTTGARQPDAQAVELLREAREALDMALSAIADHNQHRMLPRSARIEEFFKPVPTGSKVTSLSDAKATLARLNNFLASQEPTP